MPALDQRLAVWPLASGGSCLGASVVGVEQSVPAATRLALEPTGRAGGSTGFGELRGRRRRMNCGFSASCCARRG